MNRVLKKSTIKQQVDQNNLTGSALKRVSPLTDVEPIIVNYCKRLASMGAPLFRDQIMLLANSIIVGTSLQEELVSFKERRGVCCKRIQLPTIWLVLLGIVAS